MMKQLESPSGILLLDKPQGWTSHDVVAKVRRILHTKKVGHAGTLDPMATGVLVILVGKATKLSDSLLNQHKAYTAEVFFGAQTDTGDADGQIIKKEEFVGSSLEEIEAAIKPLLGTREQMVPAYSAVKVAGKKLYESARKGEVVTDRPVKTVTIESIQLEKLEGNTLTISVVCSKGTYIRVLAEEIAEQLGTLGHLTSLRRTASGQFTIEQCHSMDRLQAASNPAELLLWPLH